MGQSESIFFRAILWLQLSEADRVVKASIFALQCRAQDDEFRT